tara:strand:+ start:166 stop:387 length:222 start_codon:yes stop_codon:yes gene_type:complete
MEMESNVNTQANAVLETPERIPAVRSDSVTKYLGNLAGVLSSIVIDLNGQIANINNIAQEHKDKIKNDNNEQA